MTLWGFLPLPIMAVAIVAGLAWRDRRNRLIAEVERLRHGGEGHGAE